MSWLARGRAKSRARRWLPGGGRRDTGSDEPAARAGQQASAGATGGPGGVRSSTCCEEMQSEVEFTGSTSGGGNGGSVWGKARGGEVNSFIGVRALWRGHGSRRPAGCGMGQGRCERRRPIASRGRRCPRTAATPLVGRRGGHEHVAHWERVLDGGSTRAVPRRTDRRVVGCLGVRAHGVAAVSVHDAARRDAVSCSAGAPTQNSSKCPTLN
jgi:hypothetical protein